MQSKLQTLSGLRFTPIEIPPEPAEDRVDEPVVLEEASVIGV